LRKVDTSYALSFPSLFSSSIDNDNGQPYDRTAATASSKNGRYRKRVRNKQSSWPSYYQPIEQATSSSNKQERNGNEEYQIQKWLLSSTTLLLGDDLTFQLINGETNTSTSIDAPAYLNSSNRQQTLDNFDTKKEYRKHAISTMQSWCQWIIQCSTGRRNSRRSTNKYQLTYGSIKCSPVNAAKIVDSILFRLLNVIDIEEGEVDTEVDQGNDTTLLELIHIAITAWSNCKNRDGVAVNRTEYWLQLLQHRQTTNFTDDNDLRLYEECYRGVIRACISSHEYQHLEKAIGLLDDMRDGHHRLYPTAQTCNLVLYGLANCKPSTKNAKQAEDILKNMKYDCQENELKYAYRPDTNTFRQVITAWSKSETTDEAAMNARRILDQMLTDYPSLDPDASTFNAIMTLYLQLGRRKEALAIFDQMCSLQQSGRKGTKPDLYSINLMLNALSQQPPFCSSEELQKAEDVLDVIRESFNVAPDVQSYNILIDSWAKSNLHEAAEKAILLLDIMERRCRLEPSIAPDCYTYTSVINAISKSKHHKKRGSWAEEIFQRMKSLHSQGLITNEPTIPVYNALLNALITSEEFGSIERAWIVFTEIIETTDIANIRTYNTMLKGYSTLIRNNDGEIISYSRPKQAEQLLDRMEISYYRETSDIVPDKYSYTTVTSAYGRSNVKRKAAKAHWVLQRMIDAYQDGNNSKAKPNTYAFNAVLNACAHTRYPEEKVEAFTILCSTLILQRKWAKPDHTTYGIFLQGCSRLLPKNETRKWRVVETVFNSCTKEGQCGSLVLSTLKQQPELYEALVGRFLTDDGLEIPLQWRRNISSRKDSATSR